MNYRSERAIDGGLRIGDGLVKPQSENVGRNKRLS
jgi:hypothetical protein